jgi:tRNA pseudouridine55 synthase
MDGVLNIHKPSGITSHDVVERVRKTLRERRIGHTGTLDPLATGVLVLCVGKATRIAQFLESGEKEYQAVMRLGITTDTLDADGRVLRSNPYAPPVRDLIIEILKDFTGSIMQRPPAYSAIKIAGVPSYKMARKGNVEPHQPRPVHIFGIELTGYEDPFVSLTVQCSKGVYIRTLCADIGDALGMGAHLIKLERTRSGNFRLERAITLDQLAEMTTAGSIHDALVSIDAALADFPLVPVSAAEAVMISHGNQIPCPGVFAGNTNRLVRLHNPSGLLLALARIDAGILRPDLVFSSTV